MAMINGDGPDGRPGLQRVLILTDGRAFPPEDLVRGRPRNGGLALQIHGWDGWKREGGQKVWSNHHPHHPYHNRRTLLLADQTLLVDYPHTRPSHRRCSFYVCREALQLSSYWLENNNSNKQVPVSTAAITSSVREAETQVATTAGTAASQSMREAATKIQNTIAAAVTTNKNLAVREVIIGTPCRIVAQALSDTALVEKWGSVETKEEFLRQFGPFANADIVYPLARTVYHLVSNHTVKVSFVHHSTKTLREGAKLAARMSYNSER
jgi:hypothetical protein